MRLTGLAGRCSVEGYRGRFVHSAVTDKLTGNGRYHIRRLLIAGANHEPITIKNDGRPGRRRKSSGIVRTCHRMTLCCLTARQSYILTWTGGRRRGRLLDRDEKSSPGASCEAMRGWDCGAGNGMRRRLGGYANVLTLPIPVMIVTVVTQNSPKGERATRQEPNSSHPGDAWRQP